MLTVCCWVYCKIEIIPSHISDTSPPFSLIAELSAKGGAHILMHLRSMYEPRRQWAFTCSVTVQQCALNTWRNNLQFLHETATKYDNIEVFKFVLRARFWRFWLVDVIAQQPTWNVWEYICQTFCLVCLVQTGLYVNFDEQACCFWNVPTLNWYVRHMC